MRVGTFLVFSWKFPRKCASGYVLPFPFAQKNLKLEIEVFTIINLIVSTNLQVTFFLHFRISNLFDFFTNHLLKIRCFTLVFHQELDLISRKSRLQPLPFFLLVQ